ncbi:MAG: carbohydrate ABC transporter permease [Chlamydiae bacterium]|nr:carbohydrate ABC transporter permease [Chlamydiota bacterium]MBI3277153.1 carbohydrate ABC transporter permease [Chlamydiota bacterium]
MKKIKDLLNSMGLHGIIFFLFLLTLMPFLWMVSTSLKPEEGIFTLPPQWIPRPITFAYYKELFEKVRFAVFFGNSVFVALSLTLLNLMLNSLAAFAFAKHKFPGREKIFRLLLLMMMVPGQVCMMPVFLILKSMHLLNTFTGLILPGSTSVFGIFLMRQFMKGIPNEILESARMDGCGELKILWSIVLPLCRPALATLTIFTFMGAWNEFLWPLIIMTKESKYTLPVALANLNGQHNTEWGLLMAGSVIVILPILVLFIIMQKDFVKSMVLSGVKG